MVVGSRGYQLAALFRRIKSLSKIAHPSRIKASKWQKMPWMMRTNPHAVSIKALPMRKSIVIPNIIPNSDMALGCLFSSSDYGLEKTAEVLFVRRPSAKSSICNFHLNAILPFGLAERSIHVSLLIGPEISILARQLRKCGPSHG